LATPLALAAVAAFGVLGADYRWLVALGRSVSLDHLPSSLPFAAAPSKGFVDAPALAELILRGLYSLAGEHGLLAAQVLAVLVGFSALAFGLSRLGARAGAAALTTLIVGLGCLPLILVARNSLFSVLLFPLLFWLLERESQQPSARIWLALPLLVLWANLHGVVLVGYGALLAYLALSRLRRDPLTAIALSILGALALCATPALWRTPSYYQAVMGNEAAQRGIGLWAPLQLSGLGWLLAFSALVLLALAAWARPSLWEASLLLVLAGATVHAARFGPWLVMLAAYPASRALSTLAARLRSESVPARATLLLPVALLALILLGLLRGPAVMASDKPLAERAARSGQVVLADSVLSEQVALYGGRVWLSDPLDAFRLSDQRLYLDWLSGEASGRPAVSRAKLVLVQRGSLAARAASSDPHLALLAADRNALLYRVR
jgi:hypothetical protein